MGASVEWTDKSRRKNVFQLDTLLGLQMLFQVDDHELAEDWYQDVKSITDKGKMVKRNRSKKSCQV
jgi:spore germination protein YaaH